MKKCKIFDKTHGNLLWKMLKIAFFKSPYFYRRFYRSRTLAYPSSSFVLRKKKKVQFFEKWDNPLEKLPNIAFFKTQYFYSVETFSVHLGH